MPSSGIRKCISLSIRKCNLIKIDVMLSEPFFLYANVVFNISLIPIFAWRLLHTDLGSLIGEYTMWKFQDFSTTQILCEINFGHFKAPKTIILTNLAALNFDFLGPFDNFKCEFFQESKFIAYNFKNGSFRPPEISQN